MHLKQIRFPFVSSILQLGQSAFNWVGVNSLVMWMKLNQPEQFILVYVRCRLHNLSV